jgi:hypothetical protein
VTLLARFRLTLVTGVACYCLAFVSATFAWPLPLLALCSGAGVWLLVRAGELRDRHRLQLRLERLDVSIERLVDRLKEGQP